MTLDELIIIGQEIEKFRKQLIERIYEIWPDDVKYVDYHGMAYCAGFKYLDKEKGFVSQYETRHGMLAVWHIENMPIESLIAFLGFMERDFEKEKENVKSP